MRYEDEKARRIKIMPPLPLKQDIDKYANGNRSEFIIDAIKEKISRIKQAGKEANSVRKALG